MLNDLRYALRSLSKNPGTVLLIMLCLGLGVGANTTIFSLTNAVFLRPLPVHEPGRLVRIHSGWDNERHRSTSIPEWQAVNARTDAFSGVSLFRNARVSVGRAEETTIEEIGLVSGNFFSVVGLTPAIGRFFTMEDDRVPGNHPVAVLAHKFWQARFGGDAGIVGRSIHVNGRPYTVLGVAPADYFGIEPEQDFSLWVPSMMFGHILGVGPGFLEQGQHSFNMIGRLATGANIERARTAAAAAAHTLGQSLGGEWSTLMFTVARGGTLANTEGSEEIRIVFLMLNAVVALVLLIACANVANILLARATGRRREIAIRLALGSGRARLVRQLMVESVLLALLGGMAGFTFAFWGADLLKLLQLPVAIDPAPDLRVLAYAFCISIAAGFVFGMMPALQGTRADLGEALKQSHKLGAPTRSKLRSTLVVSQVSLSVLLLVIAGLLLRTLIDLRTSTGGYDEQGMLTAEIELATIETDGTQSRLLLQQVLDRIRALPGVRAATLSTMVPMAGRQWVTPARSAESQQFNKEGARVNYNTIGSEYFSTLRIPLLAGRVLGPADKEGTTLATVVNRALSEKYWPSQNPIGKTLQLDDRRWEVVGLVEDAKYESMGFDAAPMMYLPIEQQLEGNITVQIRAAGATSELVDPIRGELQKARAGLAATYSTFDAIRTDSEFAPRMTATLLTIFGTLALVLAALGLYGVTSYLVAQRTAEIGVRMALGARPSRVLGMIAREGVGLAGIGLGIGLLASIAAGKVLAGALHGVRGFDPLTLAAVSVSMIAVALLASLLPARRAAAVDPVIALRAD